MRQLDQLVKRMRSKTVAQVAAICKRTGLPFGTVMKIRGGFTANPRILTVVALEKHFPAQKRKASK